MSNKRSFDAVIEDAGGGGAFVSIPFDVEETYGKKRVKVRVSIDGEPYRGSLVRMGGPCHMLPVLKQIRERLGKAAGDRVHVTVQEDVEPRVVIVPEDLKQALELNSAARAFFDTLAYSHKREYVAWIEEAKRPQTRQVRISRGIQMLEQGKKQR